MASSSVFARVLSTVVNALKYVMLGILNAFRFFLPPPYTPPITLPPDVVKALQEESVFSSSPFDFVPDDILREILAHVAGPGQHYRSIATTSRRFRDVHCLDKPILLLSNRLLNEIFSFVGESDYRFVAGTCRRFQQVYVSDKQGDLEREKETTWENVALSVGRANLYWQDMDEAERPNDLRRYDLERIFKAAVKAGRVDVLNWTVDRGLTLARVRRMAFYLDFVPAIENGHVQVLEWGDAHNVEWFDATLSHIYAVEHGRVNVLNYMVQRNHTTADDVVESAAKHGQIAVLEWMNEQNMISFENGRNLWWDATYYGHPHVLDWLLNNESSAFRLETLRGSLWMRAASYGHPHVLDWLLNNESSAIRDETLRGYLWMHAACNGHIPVLEWLWNKGFYSHCHSFSIVCGVTCNKSDRTEVLEWTRDHGILMNDACYCLVAAGHGDLATLQWLRENRCPWDDRVRHVARSHGFLELEEWAIANGCP